MGAKTWVVAGLVGAGLAFGAAPAIAQYGPLPEPENEGIVIDTTTEPDVMGVEIVAPAPVPVGVTPSAAQAAPGSSSTLPVTGGDIVGFLLFGTGAVAAGTVLTRANRLRQP